MTGTRAGRAKSRFPINLTPAQVSTQSQARLEALESLAAHLDTRSPPAHEGLARKHVWGHERLDLYHYPAQGSPKLRTPLLIVYALVNRPYMLDLQPERSLIRALTNMGLDLYLIEWRAPQGGTLEDYVEDALDGAVAEICRRHEGPHINLLGVCQGGTLSLCYSALHPKRVANLITMVTPVDFQTEEDLLSRLVRHVELDDLVALWRDVPGDLLNGVFLALRPFLLTSQKYVDLPEIADDPARLENFLLMEGWINDSPCQPGPAFLSYVQGLYQHNHLLRGEFELGGRRVDLRRVTQPVLNLYAESDHLVPPRASQALAGLIGSEDYTERGFPGGHIGIYVGRRAQTEVAEAIRSWLAARDASKSAGRPRGQTGSKANED